MARNAHIKHTVDFILWYIVCMCVIQLTWCQAFEGVILHHAKALVIHRSWNPQNPLDFTKPTKSHETPRDPTDSHENPRNPLSIDFTSPEKCVFHPGEKPTESHGIPRKPTESHDRGFYTSFFPRWKTHENLRNPTNTHGVPWNPTESHDHGFYMFIYYFIRWGAGIPIKIKHVFMWCVNQEPATCPHLMQGSLQKYHPKSG